MEQVYKGVNGPVRKISDTCSFVSGREGECSLLVAARLGESELKLPPTDSKAGHVRPVQRPLAHTKARGTKDTNTTGARQYILQQRAQDPTRLPTLMDRCPSQKLNPKAKLTSSFSSSHSPPRLTSPPFPSPFPIATSGCLAPKCLSHAPAFDVRPRRLHP
jgi:hypothetical protein